MRFERGHLSVGSGDMPLFQQITSNMQKYVNEFQQAGWLIRDGILLSRSIDDFLDLHRNDPRVTLYGKAAIVRCILDAERNSKLYFRPNGSRAAFSPTNFRDTWLVKFVEMLTPGIPREDVRQIFDSVSFIVFNYDRCIEFFLLHALQMVYGIDEKEAQSALDDLEIIHPYGVIDPAIPFGAGQADFVKLAGGIKTYTEQIGSGEMTGRIAGRIHDADHIVFLGFAYHDQNMLLLNPHGALGSKKLFGTGFGMSDTDVEVTSKQVDAWFRENQTSPVARKRFIKIENQLKCADLFDHYAKTLTGG